MTTNVADTLAPVQAPVQAAVQAAGQAFRHGLAVVPAERLDDALRAMADELGRRSAEVLEANAEDLRAARADGIRDALADRLRLDDARLEAIAGQLYARGRRPGRALRGGRSGSCPAGCAWTERRRPVGVIGANFEARPNVVVDIASQFVKSRNAGVLRTGSAAIRSAVALADEVIAPALSQAGLDPAMIQLVRVPGQDSARALVSQPGLIPLVILRGSGDSTRSLAAEAARHGVRTMAHADGGAVLYLDAAADAAHGGDGWSRPAWTGSACATGSTCCWCTRPGGTSCCRGSACWGPGWASACRCRRTPIRSATSGRWTPGTRRP